MAPSKKPDKLLIMCFASIQNITSQTFRISDTLVFLCIGATILHFFVLSLFIVFWSIMRSSEKDLCRKCAKNIEKIRENMKLQTYGCFNITRWWSWVWLFQLNGRWSWVWLFHHNREMSWVWLFQHNREIELSLAVST